MDKNVRKGFTLIELIAVLVILAIILAIAVPSITGIIKSTKEKVCVLDAQMMEKAAKTYVQMQGVTLQNGKSTTISMQTLQAAKYLSDVLDPNDHKTSCEGYVVITNYNGDYSYHASIKCSNTCKSADYDDGLDNTTSPLDLDTVEKNGDQYFEGANPNNWVKFGRADQNDNRGLMWRIIKIDNTGVKMVYEGLENGALPPLEDGRALIDGSMGVPWDNAAHNKWNAPVSLVGKLNDWLSHIYVINLQNYLTAAPWKVGGVPYQDPTNLRTFLTYQDIDSTAAGGSFDGLTNYDSVIGTINAVDFMFTSDNDECTYSYKETGSDNECAYNPTDGSLNNFLQKDRYHWWTLNARSDMTNRAWNITNSGLIGSSLTNLSAVSVRPVLNLKLDTVFVAGTGTIEDPYILEKYMVGISDAPKITLNGDETLYVRQYDPYLDPGASAVDEQDGDLTNSIVATNTVNPDLPGTYTVTYNVNDSDGNAAIPVTRKVVVVERDRPIITLNGDNPTYVTIQGTYTEPGATAYDINYGNISSDIVITGTVDTTTLGTYYIKYNVTNRDGIVAPEVTRRVIVRVPTPKIILNGANPELADIGLPYTDAGATATDEVDGDLTSSIVTTIEKYDETYGRWSAVSSVSTNALANYRYKYSVTNSYGVNAFVYRTVKVVSVSGPTITFTPDGGTASKKNYQTTIGVTKKTHDINTSSLKYFKYNNYSYLYGDITRYFTTPYRDQDIIKFTGGTGYYYAYAIAKDVYGDTTMKRSKSFRLDNSRPVIYQNSGVSRVLLYQPYSDPGATAYDEYYDGNLTSKIIRTSNVNTSKEGIYYVTYEVTDSAGNTTTSSRRIEVYHPTPVIYLNGGSSMRLLYGTPYVEPGATATDEVDGDLTSKIKITGTVDHMHEGTYTITYSVTNSSGHTATRTRTVQVYIPDPVISLIGSNPVKVMIHSTYTDAGATATDTFDGNITNKIITTGTVNVDVAGTYTITYSVTNNLGKTTTKPRTVEVYVPTPKITMLGASPFTLFKGQTYSDPGATAMDDLDGDVTSSIVTTGTVNVMKEGTYPIVYTVANSEGGIGTATRYVIVRKSNLTITLSGDKLITILKGTAYTEPGFTATDEVDGDITNRVLVTSNINPSVAGTYGVTYSVTNSGGDTKAVIRTVIVRPPVITISLIGGSSVEMIKGSTYSEPGYTATDEIEGDITRKVTTTTDLNPSAVGTYTITYNVKNSGGDVATATRSIVVRNPKVTLTLNGDTSMEIPIGSVYSDPGATATDELLGDVSSSVIATPNLNPNVLGTYYVDYEVTSSGVKATARRTVKVVPLPGPIITFSPNGDSTYSKQHQTTVTITKGNYNLDNLSFKYLWKTDLTQPIETNFIDSLNSGDIIETPVDATGRYYLFVLAKDIYGNTSILGSNGFSVDNTPPVLTLIGDKVIETPVDGTYTELGVNVVEKDSGLDDKGVVVTSNLVPGIIGTYQVTYNATDKVGNKAIPAVRTVSVIEASLKDAPTDDFVPLYDASYFIGANPANWVEFGNAADNDYDYIPMMWRIIKADDTGIKIVYEGVKSGTTTKENGTIGNKQWDDTNNTWNRPATIRTALNNFYNNIRGDDKDSLTSKINWCVGKINSPYAFDNFKNDGCAVLGDEESAIGLANAADYILTSKDPCSGYNQASCGTNNFLKKGYSYYTISTDAASDVAVFIINSNGGLTRDEVTKTMAVRPVVNLRPDVLILGGEGTFSNPYKLNTRTPMIDSKAPTITFNPASATGQLADKSVEVVVTDDLTGVNTDSLKYVWTTSTTQPDVSTITNGFENGSKIIAPATTSANYYLWVVAKDKKGNQTIAKGGPYLIDNEPPVITLKGSATVTIAAGSVYSDAGATATDNMDGNITTKIKVVSNVIPTIPGNYKVTYNVTDTAGNNAVEVVRIVNVYETVAPIITFGTNGSSSYVKSVGTTVTVTDNEAVDETSLKYVWTTNSTAPPESGITTAFTNGSTITTPVGVAGDYYLWVIAKDTNGNKTIAGSKVFHIDNIAPAITIIGGTAYVFVNTTYSDQGATATDNMDGNITSSISITSNINVTVTGDYTVTYSVSDRAGNSTTKTRTVKVISINEPVDFDYAGGVQTFTIPMDGLYKLEVWGAEGGNRSGSGGGKGGYASGMLSLKLGEVIYVYIGGKGDGTTKGYNGGGTPSIGTVYGGGASDMRVQGTSLYNRIIVAGGGGSVGASNKPGGAGGGSTGESRGDSYGSGGAGGSQTAGGSYRGGFGVGGSGYAASGGYGGAGGGGWYGGGGANPDGSGDDDRGGGGGSGYVLTSSSTKPSGYLVGAAYNMINTQNINGTAAMPSVSGSTETGHAGNGHGRITEISPPSIEFGTNGNSAYVKSASTTVDVTDNGAVNTSSLKYQWTTSTAKPTEASFTTAFTNGGTINTPAGVSGTYYLWVIAKDTKGNTTIEGSNAFYLDNGAPTITMIGGSAVLYINTSYKDAGATASDNIEGDITSKIVTTSNLNTAAVGTYTITYSVQDNSGNVATSVSRTVKVLNNDDILEFAYTGTMQSVTMPATGQYKLEVWGAEGGNRGSSAGGKGGYASGIISLKAGDLVFINVGGKGDGTSKGYNGGGAPSYTNVYGGGATDIRIGGSSLYNRAIVAGGGGSVGASSKPGGAGGGDTGQSRGESYGSGGSGGNQTAGGTYRGGFGVGGSGYAASGGYGGAGGGGWYGGGGANPDGSGDDDRGGGGGSGYVLTSSSAKPSGYLVGSDYYMTNAQNINGTVSMPNTSGGTETGHSGNGYAKIIEYSPPNISFGTNGSSTYSKGSSTTINVTDNIGVNASSLEYQWTTSTTQPTEASFTISFTNGATINTPSGVTGQYYLWVIAKDNRGSTTIKRTNAFNLDNTKPAITVTGRNEMIFVNDVYNDEGATATDNIDGDITSKIVVTTDLNTAVVGEYTVTYNVTDSSGNIAASASRLVKVVSPSGTIPFEFIGSSQQVDVPLTGKYKLEVWGAEGGGRSTGGGKGGYSTGIIQLTEGQTIYVYVGGKGDATGKGFNGGGAPSYTNVYGGGATDIRINGASLYNRVIVAGGGGSVGAPSKPGGYAGGATGQSRTESYGSGGGGATQTAGGANRGTFGVGGSGVAASGGYGGAGGGGWYGGGGTNPDGSGDDDRGGGGGSGFVYTSTATLPSGYLLNSSYYLTSAQMIAGNASMPNISGGSETGHSGNGYAKITYMGP